MGEFDFWLEGSIIIEVSLLVNISCHTDIYIFSCLSILNILLIIEQA